MTTIEIVALINAAQNARNEFTEISVIHSHDNVYYILYNGTFFFFSGVKLDFINRNGNIFWVDDISKSRTAMLVKMFIE